jgi:hypothetical protein
VRQELRDELFLVTMTEGVRIKSICDSLQKPNKTKYSGRGWDIFKGILTIAEVVGDEEAKEHVIGFAVDARRSRLERDHDNSPDMIVLNYVAEIVTSAG